MPDWVHQARFAITNNKSDTLSFVSADPAKPAVLGDIPVGDLPVELEGPHHLAASPDGKYIYYCLSNYVPGSGSGPHGAHGTGNVEGSLVKLDALTGEKIAEVLVNKNPGDVILSKDGKTAFVTHFDLLAWTAHLSDPTHNTGISTLAIIDTDSMQRIGQFLPLCATGHGEGLSPDGKTLYVVCDMSDELAVIDVSDRANPKMATPVHVGVLAGGGDNSIYQPYALSVSPADGRVWVSDNASADVRVYDPVAAAMQSDQRVALDGVVMFSAFTRDGRTLYVTQQSPDKLYAIDIATRTVTSQAMPPGACVNMHAIQLMPDEQSAVLVCEGDHTNPGSVVTMRLNPMMLVGSVNVGVFPDGAAYLPAMP